jgi:hypothetical protein
MKYMEGIGIALDLRRIPDLILCGIKKENSSLSAFLT